MFFTVYKTTNHLNQQYYIGVHKTEDPLDPYLGSGVRIRRSVAKYGSCNFSKEILFIFDNQEEAWRKEEELVSVVLQDPLCLNLCQGGKGGFDYINSNPLQRSHLYNPALKDLWRKTISEGLSASKKFKNSMILRGQKHWSGKKHKEETRIKMSLAGKKRTGERNSQFGSVWVCLDGQEKKVRKDEEELWLNRGWQKGRVNKPPTKPRK